MEKNDILRFQNISLHINNCFREGELEPDSVVKDSLTTANDGKTYHVRYYNLDVIEEFLLLCNKIL